MLDSITGISFGFGVLMASILGVMNTLSLEDDKYWRFVALFPIIINVIQFILLWIVVVESPKFYVTKGDLDTVNIIFLRL